MKNYSFEKLNVWQRSKDLCVQIYKLTDNFPVSEKYGFNSQLRRAALSVSSNLAEGSSRISYKEKARYTEIAFGSLMEVLSQLLVAKDLELINDEELMVLRSTIEEIGNKLNKLKISQVNKMRINA